MTEDILPETEVFSPILLEEYIRLMTAAHYISSENKKNPVTFEIAQEYYQQIADCPIQAPLIGLSLSYDKQQQKLSVTADDYFLKMYENKIQEEVAINYKTTNTKRYNKYIKQIL